MKEIQAYVYHWLKDISKKSVKIRESEVMYLNVWF